MDAVKLGKQRCWLTLVLALLSPAEACADSMRNDGEKALKAQAQIDFRIVIPERLHLPTNELPSAAIRTRQFVSRTVERRPDRTVITLAMP